MIKKTLLILALIGSIAVQAQKTDDKKPEPAPTVKDTTKPKVDSPALKIPEDPNPANLSTTSGLLSFSDLNDLNEFLLDNPKVTPRAKELVIGWLTERLNANAKSIQDAARKAKTKDPAKH
jgi:hypothetical protein